MSFPCLFLSQTIHRLLHFPSLPLCLIASPSPSWLERDWACRRRRGRRESDDRRYEWKVVVCWSCKLKPSGFISRSACKAVIVETTPSRRNRQITESRCQQIVCLETSIIRVGIGGWRGGLHGVGRSQIKAVSTTIRPWNVALCRICKRKAPIAEVLYSITQMVFFCNLSTCLHVSPVQLQGSPGKRKIQMVKKNNNSICCKHRGNMFLS